MGCRGRHLFALLFLLPSLAFASNISECFSSAPLEKFWEHPGYFDYSPHVSNLGIFKIFSYEFDNSTQSLGLHNLSIISSQELSSAINPKFKNEFSPILKEIEDAQAHLAAAKTAQSQSHELSLAAQRFASQILDQNTFYLLAIPQTSTAATILIFLKTQDASRYVSLYPASLVETYSQSAKAYDSVQRAAHLASILVDEKMHQLSFAGANSAKYSGKAKSTYYNYQTLLSSRVFCNRSKAEQIRKYFSSKPQMPNFSSTGFADHILQTAGEGNSSALFILAKAYSELSAAYDSMEQEYAQARLLASDSSRKLASQISQLEAEKLELIDSLPNTKKEASVSAGAGFSGLSSGLKIAKERLVSSQLLLSSSQEIAKSKSYPNYLSDAIEMASRSHQDSQTALTSLSRIRENAAEATELKRQEAQEAIARAEELLFEQVGTELPQDSQLRAQAFVVL
ncbi:MAG: hypothetical protein QW275_00735, partial [Candidatus Anstonellaceae archaeon]